MNIFGIWLLYSERCSLEDQVQHYNILNTHALWNDLDFNNFAVW